MAHQKLKSVRKRTFSPARNYEGKRGSYPSEQKPLAAFTASFTATEAKNEFGRVFEKAIQGHRVMITKHDTPKAVLMSIDDFNNLSQSPQSHIDSLTAAFDSVLARMQSLRARRGMDQAFHASPKRLGRAAVATARKRG